MKPLLNNTQTTLSEYQLSRSMPRIHSKQESRLMLPSLNQLKLKQFINLNDQEEQKPKMGNFFDGLVKGKKLMESQKQLQFPKTQQNFYRLVYKAQYSFRPTKLNPRQVSLDQPTIQKKLGGPTFAFRTIQSSEQELRKNNQPNLQVVARQQVNYLNESHSLNESLNTQINQILHGKIHQKKQQNEMSRIINEESENSIVQ